MVSLDSYYTYLRQYLLTSGKIRRQNSSQRYQQALCGGHVTIVKFKGNTAFLAIAFMFEKKYVTSVYEDYLAKQNTSITNLQLPHGNNSIDFLSK